MAEIRADIGQTAKTHITRFKHPRALALFVYLVPIPQSDECPTGDILRCQQGAQTGATSMVMTVLVNAI
jgi:hypothetical protein